MNKNQIAAQLYCFHDFIKTPQGIADTFRRLHAMGYEAVQLTASLPEAVKAPQLLKFLKDHGLAAVSSHEAGAKILEATDEVIQKLKALKIRHLAYPGPHCSPTGAGEVIALAEKLNAAARKFRKHGITLAYHNHAVEFKKFEGQLMLDLIYDHAPELAGEIDTYWVQRGGGDPLRWIQKLAGRMEFLHVKDYGVDSADHAAIWSNVPVMKPVGSGNLDWNAIIPAAEKAGVKCFIVEHDADVADPFASFAESFRFLTKNFVK